MTDLRKAAEQALEALQDTCDHLPAKTGVEREVDEAITALQVALAQPDEVLAEREACAKVCEQLGMATNGMNERNYECATAIRARGKK